MAKQSTITTSVNGKILTFSFDNGKTITLDYTQLDVDIAHQALIHGLKAKLIDAAAISRNPETGRSASTDDKFTAVAEVHARLLAGEWNKRREAGEGGSGGLLLRALVVMYDGRKTVEDIKTYLAARTDAEKAALRKNAKVAPIIERIRASEAKVSDVDTDALLGELGD